MTIRFSGFWIVVLLLFLGSNSFADEKPFSLDQGWEYRWGDSPVSAEGVPVWTVEPESVSDWHAIDFPSNPPDRSGNQHVWYRIVLPDLNAYLDPVVYINSIDLIAQVYLEDQLIYQFGEFDDQGRGQFAGWPWHMISLPKDAGGQTLYFRIYSDYTDIGLWGEVSLFERADLLLEVLNNSLKSLISSIAAVLIAFLAFTLAILKGQRRRVLSIGLFSLASAGMLLGESQARQLLFDAPLFWVYLAAGSYYFLPVAMGILLAPGFQNRSRQWMTRIWQLHLLYLVIAIGLSLLGWINLSITYPVFDGLFALTLFITFILIVKNIWHMPFVDKYIVVAYTVLALLLLEDMAVAHGFLHWRRVPVSYGILLFSATVVLISVLYFSYLQVRLRVLNESLELKVKQRTEALEKLSYEDSLTGLKNRRFFDEFFSFHAATALRTKLPLTLVMCDLDYFKQFNDTYGHPAGDAVLKLFADLLRENFRDTDLVCRLGGEEFVILLPNTDSCEAKDKIQLLLTQTREHEIYHEGQSCGYVSVSAGLASWPEQTDDPDRLMMLADKALYAAKESGRDRVG
ncbi:hypothetical protein LH51_08965 [Nitrincola sp. A-D6]|uniref:diguanylate cyclase n=1 Tax=Nitrincola sp. A-D6 TaxID=1545442 RepID=UPI00051F98E0|nr:diguanylate cyclase [Nitrincola sp. A-D6]KGK42232.1 hypothetical protein LH51_08965 [Nitrincola sp. A-D6]